MFLLGVISLTVDKMVLFHQTSGVSRSARMIKSPRNVSMTPESIDTTENTIARVLNRGILVLRRKAKFNVQNIYIKKTDPGLLTNDYYISPEIS